MVKNGVQHLAFSPSGDRIVSVGLDPDHTVAIYDTSNGHIISSAKGILSPNNVYDIAYSPDGSEVVLVGTNQVCLLCSLYHRLSLFCIPSS
jgi:microtubule-associated protein-like 6